MLTTFTTSSLIENLRVVLIQLWKNLKLFPFL